MQTVLVFIIVVSATAYALWRIIRALFYSSDPCAGCSGCPLKAQNIKNYCCPIKNKFH